MSNQPPTPDDLKHDDEAGIEHLLRKVGARDEPSQAMADQVRNAVHAEWQATVGARLQRRRLVRYSLAAGILGVAITSAITWRFVTVEPYGATIARIDGSAEVVAADGEVHPTAIGHRIAVGEVLRTGGESRVALDFGNGLTARVDRYSELKFSAARHIGLVAGAVYVDAVPGGGRDQVLTVDTALGDVRHVGTQYQARLVEGELEVGIREGRVEITNPRGTNSGAAGEQLRFSAQGDVARRALTPFDASWQWAMAISPAFNIDNQTLGDFLAWAARETGRKLTFDSPGDAAAASQVKLRGSIEGLDVNTALTAVVSTTQFKLVKADDESIHVSSDRD